MREFSTQKCKYYDNSVENLILDREHSEDLSYHALREQAVKDVMFRSEHPGDHINVWDFERLEEAGLKAGFSHVVESKQHGSLSPVMQGCKFDKKSAANVALRRFCKIVSFRFFLSDVLYNKYKH